MHNKVLILANSSNGLYNFRKELIAELKKENEILVSIPEEDKKEELEQLGCRIIHTSMERRGINPVKDFKIVKDYLKLIKRENPSYVITYTIKPNIYGGFASRLRKVSYAVNITGLGTAFQKKGMLRSLVVLMYKIALKNAKVVFFENEENRQLFISENIIDAKQTCLLNGAGVNLEKFVPTDYPQTNELTKFLFVGRVMREKGVEELFEAMGRLYREGYPVCLDILGGYEEKYDEKIAECTEQGWLKYHGYQNDVRPFIKETHCFVLPSWHEGMANTNLECAASARPVITSNIHGCKEAVIEGVSGFLCEKQNTDNLYEVMKKFTRMTYEERKAMGMAGRKHMEEIFDKKKVVKATIEGLKRL